MLRDEQFISTRRLSEMESFSPRVDGGGGPYFASPHSDTSSTAFRLGRTRLVLWSCEKLLSKNLMAWSSGPTMLLSHSEQLLDLARAVTRDRHRLG